MAKAGFVPQDPAYVERVQENFRRQAVMNLLGAKLVKVEPGFCEIHLPCKPEFTRQHGYVHAGITTTVIDSAGGYAAYTLMPASSSVLSIEFKINFLAPAQGELMRAMGRVKRAGRTVTVCELEAVAVQDGKETPVATGLQTLIQVGPHDAPKPVR